MTEQVFFAADADENTGHRFSWGLAILGGVAAIATTFLLLSLGAGLGLMLVKPIAHSGPSAPAFLTLGAIYFLVAQAFGFAVGGHLAGRLLGPLVESRVQEDFRAAAHGFAAWAVTVCATLTMMVLLGLSTPSGGAAQFSYGIAASTNHPATPIDYWVDKLCHPSDLPSDGGADIRARDEVSGLLAAGIANGNQWSAVDQARLVVLTAGTAGLPRDAAERRLTEVESDIRRDTDAVRKVASYTGIWTALSLLFGMVVATGSALLARIEDDREALD